MLSQTYPSHDTKRRQRSPRPTPPVEKKIVRMKELTQIIGRCRAAIYRDIRDGRFPQSISLGPKARGWLMHEISLWLEQRAAERDHAA